MTKLLRGWEGKWKGGEGQGVRLARDRYHFYKSKEAAPVFKVAPRLVTITDFAVQHYETLMVCANTKPVHGGIVSSLHSF